MACNGLRMVHLRLSFGRIQDNILMAYIICQSVVE